MTSDVNDGVWPFMLESGALRGRLVRSGPMLDIVLAQHQYPDSVSQILSEAIAVAVALSASIHYEGVFTFQMKSSGAVRLLIVDVMSDGGVRASARFDEARIAAGERDLLADGHLLFSVDQSVTQERYQGIVELKGGSIADAVQAYFRQSEQIPTGLVVAARRDEDGHWQAGCLMLQRMPQEGGVAMGDGATAGEDDWHRAMALMQTCTSAELTDPTLTADALLYRLFHEDGVRAFACKPLTHRCRCSEARVRAMLAALPQDEVEALTENGLVSVTCEFCNRRYDFDATARATLWATDHQETHTHANDS